MRKIKLGIYGCGTIAEVHAKAISDIADAELFSVADLNPSAAQRLAAAHGCASCESIDALLGIADIDAISICTPNGTHASLAIKALGAGKNVILEKPMAITVAECDEIIEAVRVSGKRLTVISQMRTSPDVLRAKEIVDSGVLGKIVVEPCAVVACRLHARYVIDSAKRGGVIEPSGAIAYYHVGDAEVTEHIAKGKNQ